MYIPTTDKTKAIKKALKAELPKDYKVRVKRDSGTAAHWINASIEIPQRPQGCECEEYGYCKVCREVSRELHNKVDAIGEKALAAIGTEFSTYCSDDGYDSTHTCFSINIKFARPEPKPATEIQKFTAQLHPAMQR